MTIWLAPEQIADRSAPDVVQLVDDYKRLFSRLQPTEGNGLDYKAIVVVFTDVSPDRARGSMDDVRQHLAAYREDGIVLAEFYEGNERTPIYNPSFRPFTPPVPFLLVRHAVINDWKLFLYNDELLNKWGLALESPPSRPLPRNYAAPTGGGSNRDADSGRSPPSPIPGGPDWHLLWRSMPRPWKH